MAVTDFIAAIELGSTEISGIAGKKNTDGSIQILAYASERSSDCIKKGTIYNLDKTGQCLTSIIQKMESQLQASIKKIYVGIGGQSLRSIRHNEEKILGEDTKISQALIDSLMQANKELPLVNQEILAVEPQEYKVGNNLQTEPVGISADFIEGRYLNIVARPTLRGNLRQCFRQTGYEVADYLLSPLVTADVILTEGEKRSGCALIDMGADTTTVSVYKNNILRHLAVIPLGGRNITKDICDLQIEEEDAEQLKLTYGSAYTEPEENEEDKEQKYSLNGKVNVPASKLADIIEARIYEIIANVSNQIVESKYDDKLLAGLILTGGAANMPNIEKAFSRITKIDKIRIARNEEIALNGSIEIPQDGTHNTLIGLLAAGKENCCKVDTLKPRDMFAEQQEKEEQEKLAKQQQEEQRQKEKELKNKQRVEAILRDKERQEEERKQRRLDECDALISAANDFLKNQSFGPAKAKLDAARNMRIAEKTEEINQLEELIKSEQQKHSWTGKLKAIFGKLSDEAMS